MFYRPRLKREEFVLLKGYLHDECGLLIPEEKDYLVESLLSGLVQQVAQGDFTRFYQLASADTGGNMRQRVMEAMTTGETYWFRDDQPWPLIRDLFETRLIPLLDANHKRHVQLWSAACSTGQEPYSLAMVSHYCLAGRPDLLSRVHILATDVSPSALFLAISGRYQGLTMSRGLPEDMRQRYFFPVDGLWEVKPDIKQLITFRQRHLLHDFGDLPHFDLILCRRIINYLHPELRGDLYTRLGRQLTADGRLFLGEDVSMVPDSVNLKADETTAFYRLEKPEAS